MELDDFIIEDWVRLPLRHLLAETEELLELAVRADTAAASTEEDNSWSKVKDLIREVAVASCFTLPWRESLPLFDDDPTGTAVRPPPWNDPPNALAALELLHKALPEHPLLAFSIHTAIRVVRAAIVDPRARWELASRFERSFRAGVKWEEIWKGELQEDDDESQPGTSANSTSSPRSSSLAASLPLETIRTILHFGAQDLLPAFDAPLWERKIQHLQRATYLKSAALVCRAWSGQAQLELVEFPFLSDTKSVNLLVELVKAKGWEKVVRRARIDARDEEDEGDPDTDEEDEDAYALPPWRRRAVRMRNALETLWETCDIRAIDLGALSSALVETIALCRTPSPIAPVTLADHLRAAPCTRLQLTNWSVHALALPPTLTHLSLINCTHRTSPLPSPQKPLFPLHPTLLHLTLIDSCPVPTTQLFPSLETLALGFSWPTARKLL